MLKKQTNVKRSSGELERICTTFGFYCQSELFLVVSCPTSLRSASSLFATHFVNGQQVFRINGNHIFVTVATEQGCDRTRSVHAHLNIAEPNGNMPNNFGRQVAPTRPVFFFFLSRADLHTWMREVNHQLLRSVVQRGKSPDVKGIVFAVRFTA